MPRHLRSLTLFVVTVLALHAMSVPAVAHPPDADGKHEHEVPLADVSRPVVRGIVRPDIEGPRPWSDKPFLDDPNRFQIAIMTDRTGGHRPGVWMKAVEKVNLLRPEFVMSVGDLIEGYTDDEAQADKEWKEFLGFVDQLEMKFFFVAGNHDVTNPMLHKKWRERFGRPWYSFDYKGVHFICLCTEDPNFRIGDEQLAWLKKDLEKSKDARWTLVFQHKPLWWISERYVGFGIHDKTNWPAVAELLKERKHTIFCGHAHWYTQFNRNGTKYYQLATTGGGSQLRGFNYGEFDHIMWLTMEDDGPRVANLLLDGIQPGDVVTEESLKRFREFSGKAKIEVAPILVGEEMELSEGQIDIRLVNEFDSTVSVSGRIQDLPLRRITVDPVSLDLTAEPGKTAELSINVKFDKPVPLASFSQTSFRAKVTSEGMKPLAADQLVPVVIDRRYDVRRRAQPVVVDGDASDWSKLPHETPNPPLRVGPAGQWQGPGDLAYKFQLAYDDKFLYVATKVTDDRVVSDDGKSKDEIVLILDARPIGERSRSNQFSFGCFSATLPATNFDGEVPMVTPGDEKLKCKAAVRTGADGYVVEAAIPIEAVTLRQGKEWHSVQFTILAQDVDDPNEQQVGIAWRGTGNLRRSNKNFGQFLRVAE